MLGVKAPKLAKIPAIKPKATPKTVAAKAKKAAEPQDQTVQTETEVTDVGTSSLYNEKYLKFLNDQFNAIEKTYEVSSSSAVRPDRFSTGLLVVDFISSGGIASGIMANFIGQEASSKTTLVLNTLGQSLKMPLAVRVLNDAESALDPEYASALFGQDSAKIFESKQIRYYDTPSLEGFFRSTAAMARRLPNKRWHTEANTFCLEWPNKQGALKQISELGFKVDRKLSDEAIYRVLIDNTNPQGIVVLDSLAALLTDRQTDEETEDKQRMAERAGAFSNELPRLVSLLSKKAITFFSVNQLRKNPGVMYASSSYEPGGEAIKFNTSFRCEIRSIWPPYVKNEVSVEPSVEVKDGHDTYAYKEIKNKKSKIGKPFLSGTVRVWVSDGTGKARGYCPVFDTYTYLKLTGRIGKVTGPEFKPNKLQTLTSPPFEGTWSDFKLWVLKGKGVGVRAKLFQELKTEELKARQAAIQNAKK